MVVPESATRLVYERHTFHCNATGAEPLRVTWRHNGQKLRGNRHRVLPSGSLRLRRLRPNDRGQYVCKVRNKFGHVESPPAELVVQGTYMAILIFTAELMVDNNTHSFIMRFLTKK